MIKDDHATKHSFRGMCRICDVIMKHEGMDDGGEDVLHLMR